MVSTSLARVVRQKVVRRQTVAWLEETPLSYLQHFGPPAHGPPIARASAMDPTLLMAAAGLRARAESLEVLGNNLANSATAGFKADREFYNLFTGAAAIADGPGEARMPIVEGSATDFAAGTLTSTANPLDVALSGPGFFAVEGPAGVLYTRNGSFRRSAAGRLETSDGFVVRAAGGSALNLPPGEVTVGSDGSVTVAGQNVERLEVVEFAAPQALAKAGYAYFRAADGASPPAASHTVVHQGQLEASNVNPAAAAVRLVEVTREFEMLTRAVSLVSQQMNQRALEQIPRTGS